jgi:hypothetical protein
LLFFPFVAYQELFDYPGHLPVVYPISLPSGKD